LDDQSQPGPFVIPNAAHIDRNYYLSPLLLKIKARYTNGTILILLHFNLKKVKDTLSAPSSLFQKIAFWRPSIVKWSPYKEIQSPKKIWK